MNRGTLAGVVMTLALLAGVAFIGVAAYELSYASDHPFRYGPAKVIAAAAGAGALLSAGVALLGWAYGRATPAH